VWSTHTAPFLSQFPHLHSPAHSKGLVEIKPKETTTEVDHHNTAKAWLQTINFFGLDYTLGLHICPKQRGRIRHLLPNAEQRPRVWVQLWCPGPASVLHTPSQEQRLQVESQRCFSGSGGGKGQMGTAWWGV